MIAKKQIMLPQTSPQQNVSAASAWPGRAVGFHTLSLNRNGATM